MGNRDVSALQRIGGGLAAENACRIALQSPAQCLHSQLRHGKSAALGGAIRTSANASLCGVNRVGEISLWQGSSGLPTAPSSAVECRRSAIQVGTAGLSFSNWPSREISIDQKLLSALCGALPVNLERNHHGPVHHSYAWLCGFSAYP